MFIKVYFYGHDSEMKWTAEAMCALQTGRNRQGGFLNEI